MLRDIESGKDFILCEYNRDADSYRYFFALFSLCREKMIMLDGFRFGMIQYFVFFAFTGHLGQINTFLR